MSASMLRRGLELLNEDLKDVNSGPKQKKKKAGTTVKDLVSTSRDGVRKQLRKQLQQGKGTGKKNKATVKDKRVRSAIDEYRKKQTKSHLTSNLEYFLGTGHAAKQSATQKILNHNSGRLSRHRPDKPVRKTREEKSVFTEDEFQAFQKEYFGKIVEGGSWEPTLVFNKLSLLWGMQDSKDWFVFWELCTTTWVWTHGQHTRFSN